MGESRQPDVAGAFALLLDEMEAEWARLSSGVKKAMEAGRTDEAHALVDRAKGVGELRQKVVEVQRLWLKMPRTVRKDRRPRPAQADAPASRLPRGVRTPEQAYYRPILQALVELGGQARVDPVLQAVYAQLKPTLRPVDLECMPSDRDMPRWRYRARWARHDMLKRGLVASDSPRGVWAITEQGRAYLQTPED
ncbi:MAG: hypothetical protein HUU17_04580 [Chthonomonadales bacterium]|nr:hypothetical protein [Chthonomonadales bacterium]